MNHMELRSYDVETCSHTHDFAQLVLPIKGVMELEVGNQSSIVNADNGVYIPPDERHCFSGSQGNLFLVVDLLGEDHFLNKITISNRIHLTTSIQKLIQFLHHYLIDNNADVYTNLLLNQLLLNLLSKHFSLEPDKRAIKAIQWIDLHCLEPINIKRLIQFCHLSESQLNRLFKRHVGYSIAEYWGMRKLEKAQQLLSVGNVSIEEISFKIGYENVSAFSRRFSRVFGESPSQWKQKRINAKKMRVSDN